LTTVTKEQVLKVIPRLIANGKEFHTPELAAALTTELGAPITSNSSRYWANQLILDGLLKRRKINEKLYVYFEPKAKNVSSSLTILRQ
jgi:hypothetical protein